MTADEKSNEISGEALMPVTRRFSVSTTAGTRIGTADMSRSHRSSKGYNHRSSKGYSHGSSHRSSHGGRPAGHVDARIYGNSKPYVAQAREQLRLLDFRSSALPRHRRFRQDQCQPQRLLPEYMFAFRTFLVSV